jgi:uncharacterized protein
MDHEHNGGVIKVPREALSSEALAGVIDEFVTREGTDYGHVDHTLDQKRAQVQRQLERGEVVITFDPRTGTTTLVPQHVLEARVSGRAGSRGETGSNDRSPGRE